MNNLNTDENIAGKQIQKRKKLLLIFAAVIVIVAGSSTAWWYFDLRDVQSTDDAYVKGNQIAISSLVAGSVISVNYTDTDGNDSNLLIVFYVQIMPDDFVMQLHRF